MNYSGRAPERGDVVNLIDRRLCSLSRYKRRHLCRAKLTALSTIDLPRRKFLIPEFRIKIQREVP